MSEPLLSPSSAEAAPRFAVRASELSQLLALDDAAPHAVGGPKSPHSDQDAPPEASFPSRLAQLGDLPGLATLLRVDIAVGLDGQDDDDFELRREWFGVNYVPPPRAKGLWRLMYEAALLDTTNLILTVDGAASAVLGLTVGGNPSTDWIEGFCVLVCVLVIALVAAVSDLQKEKQFRALNAVSENEEIRVVRNGTVQPLLKNDLVVGDVLQLAVGDILPADGIAFDATELRVDESALTGESDLVDKFLAKNARLFAGTRVMEGFGRMLVLCVGSSTQFGQIRALIAAGNTDAHTSTTDKISVVTVPTEKSVETTKPSASSSSSSSLGHGRGDRTPLAIKIEALNLRLSKFGVVIAVVVFLVLSVRFSLETFYRDGETWRAAYMQEYLSYFILSTTVLVVAIPEGLPLAVAIALAHSVRQMLTENNLVRHLTACETVGNATTICSDKTGTLTTNCMTVMRVWMPHGRGQLIGNEASFISAAEMSAVIDERTRRILCEGIAVNSTADLLEGSGSSGPATVVGNKTEGALLSFVHSCGIDYRDERRSSRITRVIPFSSERKRMTVVIDRTPTCQPQSPQVVHRRVHVKGATETVLSLCSHFLSQDGAVSPLMEEDRQRILSNVIQTYADQGYRTLCLAYRDIESSEAESPTRSLSPLASSVLDRDLVCVAIVGIEDPVRDGVPAAVETCKQAGIVVRMVTGDNILTARSIARKCGILTIDDEANTNDASGSPAVMEGRDFRRRVLHSDGQINQAEFDKVWPSLRVLARSSPQDKHTLVTGLMQTKGLSPNDEQLVAVTGDGTNDAPALRKAHVGFAMGSCGTSVAKEASDIVLVDDNFAGIVTAIKWGRNVYDSIQKFLQFQLTVIIVALTVAFVGAMALQASPITAVQILWVNLIMDSFASLALATEPPTQELLKRQPYRRSEPLISRRMAKHILGQATIQLILLLLLTFMGEQWFGIPSGRDTSKDEDAAPTQHLTIVFNTFVWLQLFNELNCRKIHDEANIFDAGLWKNKLCVGGLAVQIALQIIVVQFGGQVFHCASLSITQWIACVGMGAAALPVGLVLRILVPNKVVKSETEARAAA